MVALKTQLKALEEPTVVRIDLDTSAAEAKLAELEEKLEALRKGFIIDIGANGGSRGAPGFQTGGAVPGTGMGDKIPALLEPGEFVVRRERAQLFGALLQAINSSSMGGLSSLLSRMDTTSAHRMQTGGLVSSGSGAGGTINLTIENEGPFPLIADVDTFKNVQDFIYRQQLKKGRRG